MHERLIDSVGSDDKPLISDLNATYCKKITSQITTQLSQQQQQQQKLITGTNHAKPANMCKDCRVSLNPDGIS